jgi:hypothetical protein
MNLTPQRKKELMIGAGAGGGLLALIVIRKKSAASTGTVGSTFDPSSLLSGGGGFDPLATDGGGSPDTSGSFTFLTPTDPTTVLPGGDNAGTQATVAPTAAPAGDTPVYNPPIQSPSPSPLTIAGGLDPAIAAAVGARGAAPVASSSNDTGGAARTAPKSTVAKPTPKPPAKKPVSGYNRKTVAAIH